ncbi:MAG: DNA repair protein RecO [bacterium]|nr:DNA repair protein RecO [bacterium]
MKRTKTLALVLRRTNFGEADRIVNFITPEGRMVGVARGARKQKSKLAGGLEVFALNEIIFAEGKSEMRTIISARMKEFYGEIIKDLARTEFGYFAIQQIARLSDSIDSQEFFEILLKTFVSLNDSKINIELIRKWFLLRIAEFSGREINLQTDKNGEELRADSKYDFDIFEKVFVKNSNGEFDANDIKFLRLMASSEPRVLAKITGGAQILQKVDKIIRAVEE